VLNNEEDSGSKPAQKTRIYERVGTDIELMRTVAGQSNVSSTIRPATPEEVYMATAFSQSHISRCLKRHVGAVIVKKNGMPLSLGYNENPGKMKPCVSEFKCCFKDEDMHKKLEGLKDFYCPECGQPLKKIETPWICPNEDCQENLKIRFFPSRNIELCTAIHAEERAIRSLEGRRADDDERSGEDGSERHSSDLRSG